MSDKANDILKGLGFKVGTQSLIETVNTEVKDFDLNQPVRKGMGHNASDALNDQLLKGGAVALRPWKMEMVRVSPHAEDKRSKGEEENKKERQKADEKFAKKRRTDHEGALKNTHGENWHDDNDKQVEKMVSSSEEIDSEFDGEDDSDRPAKQNTRLYQRNAGGEKNYTYEFSEKSLSKESLFLKGTMKKGAFKEADVESAVDSLINIAPDPFAGKEQFIANIHENSDGMNERRVEKGQKAKKGALVNWAKEEEKEHAQKSDDDRDPAVGKKISKLIGEGKDKYQAAAIANQMKEDGKLSPAGDYQKKEKSCKKSELDELADLVKSGPAPTLGAKEHRVPVMRNHGGKPTGKQFLKAEGAGGMLFDFGNLTGNPMADNATAILNQHGDPVQMSNVSYQKQSYDQALVEFTQKGDMEYAKTASPFGHIDKNWNEQLNKPLDEQVKALYKAEADSKDPSVPAVKNEFNATTLNVGGDVIKATSETDAAVLESYRSQLEVQEGDGFVADASFGGAQRVEIEI